MAIIVVRVWTNDNATGVSGEQNHARKSLYVGDVGASYYIVFYLFEHKVKFIFLVVLVRITIY